MWRWAAWMFGIVLSLLGAMPAERRMSHAFLKIPALANEISDSVTLCGSSPKAVQV